VQGLWVETVMSIAALSDINVHGQHSNPVYHPEDYEATRAEPPTKVYLKCKGQEGVEELPGSQRVNLTLKSNHDEHSLK